MTGGDFSLSQSLMAVTGTQSLGGGPAQLKCPPREGVGFATHTSCRTEVVLVYQTPSLRSPRRVPRPGRISWSDEEVQRTRDSEAVTDGHVVFSDAAAGTVSAFADCSPHIWSSGVLGIQLEAEDDDPRIRWAVDLRECDCPEHWAISVASTVLRKCEFLKVSRTRDHLQLRLGTWFRVPG